MRESGILMPVASVPGPFGIGTLGKGAYDFVDFLVRAGQHVWQILPLSPTGFGDSPYQSCSAFAGNPYFIDFEPLCRRGLLKKQEYAGISFGRAPCAVDYDAVRETHFAVLRRAFARFSKPGMIEKQYEQGISVYTVEMLLDEIENMQLWEVLKKTDKLTLEMLVMRMQGFSGRDISRSTGVPELAINNRIARLRKKLKKFL
nr:4-alpha-glucanotransferase [Ruthenibacterium lactatiformans]